MTERGEREDDYYKSSRSIRHLLVFQIKLTADAMRDFLLSPLSIAAYVIDILSGATSENSLYLRLMSFGRRSDRIINLFDDHDADRDGEYSIDRAVSEVEVLLRQADGSRGTDAAESPDAPGEQKY